MLPYVFSGYLEAAHAPSKWVVFLILKGRGTFVWNFKSLTILKAV
jgi:hypothetical protein